MKHGIIIMLLMAVLASCVPAPTEIFTPIASTTHVPPRSTATLPVVFTMTSSPVPAQPAIAVITPDSAQLERWKEYQSALAKSFSFLQSELALCEWDILGQTNQEVYVWAVCEARGGSSVSAPAVIHLATDGSIQNVENPKHWSSDISKMFPTDIQQKFDYYHFGRANELLAHIAWRRMHPEEPPLIVLSATLEGKPTMTPSSLPTQPAIPIMTPDATQVERWKEYQTELAKLVLSDAGEISPYYENALCEWDILGRSGQEVYVWAMCHDPNGGNRKPAAIHLEPDGSIRNVEVPIGGTWDSDLLRLFPADVREKLDLYYFLTCPYCGRPEVLRLHLQYRLTHPDVPPLIVLSAIPTATPTP